MKKFTDKEKYTTTKQSKIIQPIMDKLGVREDRIERFSDADFNFKTTYHYRLDTLLWVLPDWVFNVVGKIGDFSMAEEICVGAEICTEHGELEKALADIIGQMVTSQGSEAINAAVELIELLDNYDLLAVSLKEANDGN